MTSDQARARIIVALDVDSIERARLLYKVLAPTGVSFKLGLEFLFSVLANLMSRPNREAEADFWEARTLFEQLEKYLFTDVKFHDIPNTVSGATKAICQSQPCIVTVHAQGGGAMMQAARTTIDENFPVGAFKPLLAAVTVLTSLDDKDLRDTGYGIGVPEEVELRPLIVRRLAELAQQNECDGVIASANDIETIRETCGLNFGIWTPGVRLPGSNAADQKNVATPGEAIARGATGVVIGRDITKSADPVEAVELVIQNIVETIGKTI